MQWTTKPISQIVKQIKTGSTPPTSNPEFFDGVIPWFTPSDIGTKRNLVKSSRYISSKGITEGKAKILEEGAILITCIGDIGRVGILAQNASFNQQITGLTFCDEVDVIYAYYWFVHNPKKLEQETNKAIVPILNNERLKEVELSYPPIAEQKRIAAICAKADRLRRTRRYVLELSDTYLRSVFLEMFGDPLTNPKGWKIRKLEELLTIKPHIGTTQPAQDNGLQLCVRVGELGNWYVNLEPCQYVSLEAQELKRFSLIAGDIVLARAIGSESHLGKMSIVPKSCQPIVFDSHVMRLRLNNSQILAQFFVCMIRTEGGRARFMQQARQTAVQFNINSEQMAAIEVPLPPVSLQEKFAQIVQKHERIRAQQREALRQAEHLFQTILHRAFRGEL